MIQLRSVVTRLRRQYGPPALPVSRNPFHLILCCGRFSVAMSLDGYISGPEGESDWIIMDPEIDFEAFMGSFDTVLLAIIPVLLGGVPLPPDPTSNTRLKLTRHRIYEKTGTVALEYSLA